LGKNNSTPMRDNCSEQVLSQKKKKWKKSWFAFLYTFLYLRKLALDSGSPGYLIEVNFS